MELKTAANVRGSASKRDRGGVEDAANVHGSASKRDRGGVEDCSKCSW